MPYGSTLDPERNAFLRDVVAGLSREPKSIPCKYFYDARGSELFDRITELEEYYPTRAELDILEGHGDEIADAVGPRAALIELGSGSSMKTRSLLDHLHEPAAYVPLDISEEHLLAAADSIRADYEHIPVLPVAADYSREITLPELPPHERRVIFFPGSTIGNLEPEDASRFLGRMARMARPGGGLLIGVDLPKPAHIIEPAYDDSEGVTADFNINLLHRINQELGGDIDAERFEHRAVWNEERSRVEISLVSTADQELAVNGHRFEVQRGEQIHTERSYKYSVDAFDALASRSGFRSRRHWLDDRQLFSVHYLETSPSS